MTDRHTDDRQTTQCAKGATDSTVGQKVGMVSAERERITGQGAYPQEGSRGRAPGQEQSPSVS